MMLQLMLVCCIVGGALGDNTLYFIPHDQAPVSKNFSCPDQTQCPVGNTCCQVSENSQFGCCPYNNAVCCSDGIHCCQKGTTCHPEGNGCIHDDGSNHPIRPIQTEKKFMDSVLCPDQEGMCPNGQTCCQGNNHEYACCPYPEASCCADKVHCCPKGASCDISQGRCVKKGQGYFLNLFNQPLTETKPLHSGLKNVICGDSHECPDGTTCCKQVTGEWGCCPVPKAVCCDDMVHCCPSGYKCDLSSGSCTKGLLAIKWLKKITAVKSNVADIACDSTHWCPNGNTCCMMADHRWGCCPMPKAVCCNDGAHCCPNGTTCDMPHGMCRNKTGLSTPWVEKRPALRKKVEDVKCGEEYECPDGKTCCRLGSGQWGCCPFPKAVCCSDHDHCCPHGTTCDAAQGKCDRQDGSSIEWFLKTPAVSRKVTNVICPGGQSSCSDGNTCCKLASGQWGCCPLPQAVCCSDGTHCCPSGTTCETTTGTCSRQDGSSVAWSLKTPATNKKVNFVQCDQAHECPDGNTCCKLASGQWGCCGFPKAQCCSDGIHCCPRGYTCDDSHGKCIKQDGSSVEWLLKMPAISRNVDNVVCPGGMSTCPEGNTCCKLISGQWGCCPLAMAVCCSDHLHCCPHGTTCEVSQGKCNKQDGSSTEWFLKTPAVSRNVDNVVCPGGQSSCPEGNTCCKLASGQWGCCPFPKPRPVKALTLTTNSPTDVMCPDGRSECPDGNTCCLLNTGEYGCCPLPDAVCCSDGIHCCPYGTVCNLTSMSCQGESSGDTMGLYFKHPAQIIALGGLGDSKCDASHHCPNGNTCCKNPSYLGCCALPQAVCCSDGTHCCPSGYTCNTAAGTCTKEDGSSVELLMKTVARKNVKRVICDTLHECPDGNTCCKLSSGEWGCCPMPQAVCCSDGTHCCPSGYTCDAAVGTCRQEDGTSVEWLMKTVARKNVKNIMCDTTHYCPGGNTCCKLPSGKWGCCPLPKAVCCSDGTHCCPTGYTCDTAAGTCTQENGSSVKWSLKTPAISNKLRDVICPGSSLRCPNGNTCCRLTSGQWGCCPLPQAVCCSDGSHCCPKGTTCDVTAGTCNTQDGQSFGWVHKLPALQSSDLGIFTCNGSQKKCNDGQTCCKVADGRTGCCVYTNGVCCSDGTHCCPSGFTCDVESGQCLKSGGLSTSWSHIQQDVTNVRCDRSHECSDGNTCCRLSSGQWGCCPYPKAVCCSDGSHCCPHGCTCSTSTGSCTRQDGSSVLWALKSPAVNKNVNDVQCPGGQAVCPDGNTCCKMTSGQWGCCPLPQAVCCSDDSHCCPEGTTCDVTAGTCNTQGGAVFSWVQKLPAALKSERDVPCGATSCPDSNTCCQLDAGGFGCCPLPNAICCSDGVHCCPSGTTCDTSAGTCNQQDGTSVPWVEKGNSIAVKENNVICDGSHECPNGNTCCKLPNGVYGCCPLPNAICCSDGVHCCRSGTTCDTSAGTCNQQDGTSVPWVEKGNSIAVKENNVICDGSHECPNGNTCCKLPNGVYGCCPLPNAICCSDGVHCCRSGTTCDTSAGTCNQQDGTSVPWVEKGNSIAVKENNVICDGSHECPNGNTCCKLPNGVYGCCPLPNAICCSDGVHCCPSGTTCDTSAGTCNQQDGTSVPWVEKGNSIAVKENNVICDGSHECPNGNTCCKLPNGVYGCCPLPNAVCCSDGMHCCPSGYTCDTGAGTCTQEDGSSVEWLMKTVARKNVKNIMCDTTHYCPGGNTCCKLPSGNWGCCPLPKAVCCSDGTHCCPTGYTCDTAAGTCTQENGSSVKWFLKTPAVKKASNTMCDSTHYCPNSHTCCKLPGGDWGCCPLSQAVCCSDGVHCCPEGTTCSPSQGQCMSKDGTSVAWVEKNVAAVRKSINSKPQKMEIIQHITCADQSKCPNGSTCCPLSSGGYGCCPLLNATCCADKVHCCPNGYNCDPTSGSCNKSPLRIPFI